MKGVNCDKLTVNWIANKKASTAFKDWFNKYFMPETKQFHRELNTSMGRYKELYKGWQHLDNNGSEQSSS